MVIQIFKFLILTNEYRTSKTICAVCSTLVGTRTGAQSYSSLRLCHTIDLHHSGAAFSQKPVQMVGSSLEFSLGLCVDVFANTPGVAAASMTLMGLVQPYLFELFIPRDSADDLEPTIRSIGVSSFFWYVFIMILLYCLVFFTLETFNFFNWIQWLKCIGGSTLLTYLLVMALESIKK